MNDDIVLRLFGKMVASCGCDTKSHLPKWHQQDCLYKVLNDAAGEIIEMRELLGDKDEDL